MGPIDDDNDEELADPQPYQYLSDSEKEDVEADIDLGDDDDDDDGWLGVPGDDGYNDSAAASIAADTAAIDVAVGAEIAFDDTYVPTDPQELTEEEKKRADELATDILSNQLADAPWVVSSLADDEIDGIVEKNRRQNSNSFQYDYRPRIFFVPEDDFDLWVRKDGHDHFFEWNFEGNHRSSTGKTSRSPYVYTKTYLCHREGSYRHRVNIKKQKIEMLTSPMEGMPPVGSEVPVDVVEPIQAEPLIVYPVPENQTQSTNSEKKVRKKRENLKPSPKVGCRAKLVVHKMKDDLVTGESRLRVTYYYRHGGHVLGDTSEFQHLKPTVEFNARVRNLVRLGLSVRSIRTRIHAQVSKADTLFNQGGLQREHVPTYDDIYNIFNKYWSKQIQLDDDDLKSMHRWMERLEEVDKFNVFQWHSEEPNSSKFALGFMSPFQRRTFKDNYQCIGLDSTYGTNRKKYELFTIVVQDPTTMKAIPVAFLITNDHTATPLREWMAHIKRTIGSPRFATTDDSYIEFSALRDTFGKNITIHLCLWHVMRSWSRKFKSVIIGTEDLSGKEARQEAMAELKSILYEPNLLEANQRVAAFRNKWSRHNDGKLMAYLEKYYFRESRRKRWMKAYRTGIYYAGMDTNNYVESWHNQLKSHFLRGHNRGRGDRLIYVLSHDVNSFYKSEGMRGRVRFGRHSKGETLDIKQHKCLKGKSEEELHLMVICLDGKYIVRSFSVDSVLYNISVRPNREIGGCSCTYFVRTSRVCKHMMVLHRICGLQHGLSIPSLHVLKAQRWPAEPPVRSSSPELEQWRQPVDSQEDEAMFEAVQVIREKLSRFLHKEDWTHVEVDAMQNHLASMMSDISLVGDAPQARRIQPRF